MFTISLKSLQGNLIIMYIRNTLSSESDCFYYLLHKNMVLPGNIYVIIMPKATPGCSKFCTI